MYLKTLRIKNFRSYVDTTLRLNQYNCFVGPNGAGKSSILSALNILFRDVSNPTGVTALGAEDFHLRNTGEPIEITASFAGLSDDAKADLGEYHRQGELTITARAEWNAENRRAEVRQYGSRLVMPQLSPYFEAEHGGARVADLIPIYDELRRSIPDLPTIRTKVGMTSALREYEESHRELCQLLESTDQFYGWSKGANRLARHVQWVYIPAVKHATEEESEGRNSALGALLQRTIRTQVDFHGPTATLKRQLERQYQDLIARNQGVLTDLSQRIQARLREWSHPGVSVSVDWSIDPERGIVLQEPVARATLGEGTFHGELARLGHGLQRSFIVALLTELAATHDNLQPSLILGFEEPELYQHPPQARHLANVLEEVASGGGQVLVATHSPYFVSGHGFESIRLTRKRTDTGISNVTSLTHDELSALLAAAFGETPLPASEMMARVEQVMQPSLSGMFFSCMPVLVEGIEDVAFIATQLHLRGQWTEFRRIGGHLVVCAGKTNVSRPLAMAKGLGIPTFLVFDSDSADTDNEPNHRRHNACILRLAGFGDVDPWPDGTIWKDRLVMCSPNLATLICTDVGSDTWGEAKEAAKRTLGITGQLSRKNTLWISATLEELHGRGIAIPSLDRICDSILEYATSLEGGRPTQ